MPRRWFFPPLLGPRGWRRRQLLLRVLEGQGILGVGDRRRDPLGQRELGEVRRDGDHSNTARARPSLIGLVVGGGITWGVRALGSAVFKKEAMGLGDLKLLVELNCSCNKLGTLPCEIGKCKQLRLLKCIFLEGEALVWFMLS